MSFPILKGIPIKPTHDWKSGDGRLYITGEEVGIAFNVNGRIGVLPLSAPTGGGGGGSSIDHGGLSGLTDDDHTQYLLEDGSRGLSADWDAGSNKITAEQLASDIATGTAPLIVASETLVDNLNADLLDGEEASAFQDQNARLDSIAALSPTTFTQTYATADATLGSYTADDESSAYSGIDNAQGGSVYAQVDDLNALRTAYETLRALTEDTAQFLNSLIDVLQTIDIVD